MNGKVQRLMGALNKAAARNPRSDPDACPMIVPKAGNTLAFEHFLCARVASGSEPALFRQ